MRWTKATPALSGALAKMNARLIEDEGHRNRGVALHELERRMFDWLESGVYEAVLFETDCPVGYALFRREADEVFLRQFFIERDKRRQGLGRAAMELLNEEVWGVPARVTLEILSNNRAAERFWKSVGFRDYAISMELVRDG